ncbi:hypothetical protein GC197_04400 [bacterium]|nr:hypothetical protein [bacterium]
MPTNPYQSPQADDTPVEVRLSKRQEALDSVRAAAALLTTAGLLNFGALFSPGFETYWHTPTFWIVLAVDTILLAGIGLIVAACWFLLLPTLEFLGGLIRAIIAPSVDRGEWQDAIYVSLKPARLLAIPGTILWVIWVIGLFYLNANFFVISYAVGIPAHILAACLYVPLIVRWYRLWRGGDGTDY